MRRLHALLVTAGLMAAPVSGALAQPDGTKDTKDPRSDDGWTETWEWSTAASKGRLGVMVIGLTTELRGYFGAPADRGVLIARVEPRSAAAAAGLAVGDVITEVKGTRVDSAMDVLSALSAAKKDDTVSVTVIRGHRPVTLPVKMLDDPSPRAPMVRGALPSWIEEWFESMPDPWQGPRFPHRHRPSSPSTNDKGDQSDKTST